MCNVPPGAFTVNYYNISNKLKNHAIFFFFFLLVLPSTKFMSYDILSENNMIHARCVGDGYTACINLLTGVYI